MKMLNEKVVYIVVKKDIGGELYRQFFNGSEEELGDSVKEEPETGKFDVDLIQKLFEDSSGIVDVVGKFNPTKTIYYGDTYYCNEIHVDGSEYIKEAINEAIDGEEINVEDFDHLTLEDFAKTETFYKYFEDGMCRSDLPDGSNGKDYFSWWMRCMGGWIMPLHIHTYVFVGDKKIKL